jgi:hypothetical protein
MLPNYEIQIVPSGMTIYNPPMSDDAFNPAVGKFTGVNFNFIAKEICEGAGQLGTNKAKYIAIALEQANKSNNVSGWDFWINGLEGAKTTEGCEWGAKRGRVAEVIRVLKRERDKWVKAKEGIGTPVTSKVDGKTNLTAPTWNPINANWGAIAKDLGDKLLTKQELVSILKSKISIQLAKGNNAGIIEAQKIYDGSINGLETNKNSVAWGAKRLRVNAAISFIKSTIRRPETLVDIVSGEPVKIDTPSLEDLAKETSDTEKNFFDKIGDFFGISPDDDAGNVMGDVTGGETNGSGENDKPNYTPLLAGGGIVVAVILIGVLVSAASKGKQGTLPK